MKQSSIFLKLLAAVFSTLSNAFKNSFIYKIAVNTTEGIANLYAKSKTHSVLTCGNIENYAENSVFYRIYAFFVSLFLKISSKLLKNIAACSNNNLTGKIARYIKNTSLFGKVLSKLFSWLFTLEGGFAFLSLIIFCVPHSIWNNLFGLGCAFIGFFFILIAFASGKNKVNFAPKSTYFSLCLFMIATVFSTLFSHNRPDSIRIFAFFLTSFILCIAISVFLCCEKNVYTFVKMMYIIVIITSIIGIVQAILKVEADASLTDLSLNKDMPGRVFATLGNPNNFAQMLVLFMPYCVAFALNAKKVISKILLSCLMILPVVALLQTYSRSGWIAFAVSVVVFVVLSNKRLIPLFIILCVFAIPFLPETILARILTIGNLQDSSSSYRIDIWAGAFDVLKLWWFTGLGIGPGAFKSVYPAYAYGTTMNVAHSHMQFMEVFLETGIFGFLSYLYLTFELIRRPCMAAKRCKNKNIRMYAVAAASSMTGIIFIGFFEYFWFYPRVMFAFFISAGLSIAIYRNSLENETKSN